MQYGAVVVERFGIRVVLDRVPVDEIPGTVAACAELIALALAVCPKLADPDAPSYPDVIPGGSPVMVIDDEWADESHTRRRIGFRT